MIIPQAGRRFIRLCLDRKSFDPLLENKLTFADLDSKTSQVIDYVRRFVDQYNEWPNADTILDELDVELPEVDSSEFVIDQYKEYLNQQKVAKIAEEAINLLPTDSSAAISKLLTVSEIKDESHGIISFKKSGEERYLQYLEDMKRGLVGLETLWPTINEICGGWTSPSLNVFMAKANVGKSWLSVISAAQAYLQGKTVLLVTMEDPKEAILDRLDSIIHRVNHKRLIRHKLELIQEIKYRDKLEEPNEAGDIHVCGSQEVSTVGDIVMIAETVKPDLIIVDAAYVLNSTVKTNEQWQKLSNVTQDLQNATNFTGLPWVVTTQESPDNTKKLSGNSRGYGTRGSKDWMIKATNLIALDATDDQRAINQATMQICKVKHYTETDRATTFDIHWDFRGFNFGEVAEDEDAIIEGLEY